WMIALWGALYLGACEGAPIAHAPRTRGPDTKPSLLDAGAPDASDGRPGGATPDAGGTRPDPPRLPPMEPASQGAACACDSDCAGVAGFAPACVRGVCMVRASATCTGAG